MNPILNAILNGAILSLPLTAAVWLALRLLPRRTVTASARYVIWWATLLAVVALPIAYLPASSQPSPTPVPRAALQPVAHASVEPTPAAVVPNRLTAPEPARRFPVRISTGPRAYVWSRGLLVAWAISVLFMLARLMLSCAALLRRKRAAESVEPPVPLARNARLLLSDEVFAPMAAGFLRPAILIPRRYYAELEPEQIQQIALHESAHLARRDDYALLLERAIEAVFALHPAVRFIARQIDLEREIACDARVVGVTRHPASYAACLTRVAEISGPIPVAAAAFLQRRSQLSQRVDVLLEQARNTRTRLLKTRFALAASTLVALAWMLAKSPAVLALSTPPPQVHAPLAPTPAVTQQAQPAAPADAHASLVHPTHQLFQVPLATPPIPAAPVASIVVISVEVTTPDGAYVPGLSSGDFTIIEDDQPQPLSYFAVDDTPTIYGVVAMDGNAIRAQMQNALDAMDKSMGNRVEYIQPPDPFTWQAAAALGLARLREFPNPRKFLLLIGAPDDTQGLPDPRDVTIFRMGAGWISILPFRTRRPSSYVLGYPYRGPRADASYAHIKVAVDRPGLNVRFRSGYYAGSTGTCSDWVRQAFLLPTTAVCH